MHSTEGLHEVILLFYGNIYITNFTLTYLSLVKGSPGTERTDYTHLSPPRGRRGPIALTYPSLVTCQGIPGGGEDRLHSLISLVTCQGRHPQGRRDRTQQEE